MFVVYQVAMASLQWVRSQHRN